MHIWRTLGKALRHEDVVIKLLKNRGLSSEEEIENFLNPPNALSYIKNAPIEFKTSLKKAKNLISSSINLETPIVIHGDYDADGICATAILFNTLKNELKYENTNAFIPSRFDHGYGLSKSSIDDVLVELSRKYGKTPDKVLFITVDSGITSVEEVDYVKNLGFDVIITDHHQKPGKLPSADCILWSDQIVGSSISWYLSRALGSTDPQSLGLAALATVTDVQPVLGTNRSIVRHGLNILNETPSPGIRKLLEVAGKKYTPLSTYDLGWVLGPRLNATGRIVDAATSLRLLTETDEKIIEEIALRLNKINAQRQDKTLEMYELASSFDLDQTPKIIISSHKDYHEGIIGLVAARLVKKYYRPAIVISIGDEHAKGSVRSIPGIDAISILRRFEDLFVNLGGHPMAAGFTIKRNRIEELKEKLTHLFDTEITDSSLFQPVLNIDLEIPMNLVDFTLLGEINKLKPFGVGNKEPLFLSKNAGIADMTLVGREKNHLSLRLFDGARTHRGIFFGGKSFASNLKIGGTANVVYAIRENEFNGKKSIDLVVKDIKDSS